MLVILLFFAVGGPVAIMGLHLYLAAWPVFLSGAVTALVLAARVLDDAAKGKAAAEYKQRNEALDARSSAMISEYHEVMGGVYLQAAIDKRDRRDLLEERQGHEREMRELRAALKQAQDRTQRMLDKRKKPPESKD